MFSRIGHQGAHGFYQKRSAVFRLLPVEICDVQRVHDKLSRKIEVLAKEKFLAAATLLAHRSHETNAMHPESIDGFFVTCNRPEMAQLSLLENSFKPSIYQHRIFQEVHGGQGHMLIEAAPGSGKTTTLIHAIMHVPRGKKILVCAFNRAIRAEIETKVPKSVTVHTFHSLGFSQIKRHYRGRADVAEHRDDAVVESALKKHNRELIWDEFVLIREFVSLAKSYLAWEDADFNKISAMHDIYPDDDLFDIVRTCLETATENDGTVSFDDMVYLPVALEIMRPSYDFVFVDEAQDLNLAQWILTKGVTKPDGRIVAVGDSRQAIYGFRGAMSDGMAAAARNLSAKELPLSVTYRCPLSVVALAQKYVPTLEAAPNAPAGKVRRLSFDAVWDELKTGDLVLSRKNSVLITMCLKALTLKIPARALGNDLGKGLRTLIDQSNASTVASLLMWLPIHFEAEKQRVAEGRRGMSLDRVQDRIDSLRALGQGIETIAQLLKRIDELCVDDASGNAVLFSSVHRAKGLEADRVWIAEDTFRLNHQDPRRRKEEENLYYVALTRTKKELVLFDYG